MIALGFFGDVADWDDSVRAGGRLAALPFPFPFSLPVGALATSPSNSSSSLPRDTVSSGSTISTLTRSERRSEDASGPSPDSGSLSGKLLWSSSLNHVMEGSAELRWEICVDATPRLFMGAEDRRRAGYMSTQSGEVNFKFQSRNARDASARV